MTSSFSRRGQPLFLFWLILVGAFAFGGRVEAQEGEKSRAASGAEPLADKAEPLADKAEPLADKADPFAVPDGTPEELLAYVEELAAIGPEASDPQGQLAFRKKFSVAIIEVADKILAQEPALPEAGKAARLKLIGLDLLARMGDPEAPKRLARLPDELKKAGHTELVRPVKSMLMRRRLRNAAMAGAGELEKLIGEIRTDLEATPPRAEELDTAMAAAQMAERIGATKVAVEAYREFGLIFAKSDTPEIASMGRRMEGTARRLSLVGNKMELEGIGLASERFEWADFKDKVVLVTFWATWCGPCLEEIPNILEAYKQYHDRGFEVVAISIDDARADVETFLEENEVPWMVLFDQDARGDLMSERYGVIGIPVLILVGRDGKVVSLEARGPALGRHLAELIGPAEEPEKTVAQ